MATGSSVGRRAPRLWDAATAVRGGIDRMASAVQSVRVPGGRRGSSWASNGRARRQRWRALGGLFAILAVGTGLTVVLVAVIALPFVGLAAVLTAAGM